MGKGRLFSDSSNDEVYNTQTSNETFVLSSQQNAQGLGGGVFNDSSGYGNFRQSGRDQRNADLNGALFRGNLGFNLDTAVLDVATSTINLLEDVSGDPLARVSIDKSVTISAGSTADLITILGAQRPGQRLRLYNIDTQVITIKNTASAIVDTIFTPGAVDFVLSGNGVVDLTYDITTTKWRIVGGAGGDIPGTSFPILYPKESLTPSIGGTATIDVSLTTGNAKQIQFPAGDISFLISGDPPTTVGEDFYVLFIQDSVGGRSLTSVDFRIKDGELMDSMLDKAAFAHTLFRIATLGGETVGGEITYHPILVNLSTSAGGLLSTLAIDTDKDWAGRFITNIAGFDLFANSVANNITNMGALTFISNIAVTRGQFGRSDFFLPTVLPDGLVTNIPNTQNITWTIDGTEKFQLDGPNNKLISSVDLDMNSNSITNASFVESDTANRPGSGFVRMAATDQTRWRNVLNTDDIFINATRPTLDSVVQDAFAFTVASGVQMQIGEFDISVEDNDIVKTGDVLPGAGAHEVGTTGDFYNQMHSQFFVPEAASVVTSRFGLAKTGNTLYVNFDNTNADAGFSIYEQGFESFRFYHPTSTVNELHIGSSTVFTAGEEYAIQMGENSNASARIFFIEGTGNDLILDRAGAGADQGVQIRGSGLSIARFLSTSIKIFQPLDANTKDLFNVVDIKSNGGGGATTGTIGELITNDGGFNYFMRDTLAWEADAAVKLTFSSGGITLETNGTDDDIDILAQGTNSDIDIRAATGGFLSLGRTGVNHLQFASGVTTFSNENIFLATGTEYISFLDAASGATLATPASGDINLFNDLDTGEISVKKFGGTVVSLEGGGSGISFPVIPPVNVLGTVSTNQNINLSLTTAHSTSLTLGANIDITFSNFPTTNNQIEWEIEVTQDASTAFVITWPGAVVNPPDPNTYATLGSVTVIVFRTNDGGTTIRVANTVTTTGGGGANTSLSNLTTTSINQSLLFSATGFDIGDTTNPVDQLFFGTGRLQTNVLIANKPTFTTLTGNTFDINFPTGSTFNIHENGISKHTFSATLYTAPNITISNILTLNNNAGDPVSNGQFARNVNDVKVFSGGAVRNLSNIGAGSPLTTKGDIFTFDTNNQRLPIGTAGQVLTVNLSTSTGLEWATGGGGIQSSIADGNTTATVLDSAPSFAVELNGIPKFSISNTRVDFEELNLFGVSDITMNDGLQGSPTDVAKFIPTIGASGGLVLNILNSSFAFDLQINNVDAFHVDTVKTLITSTSPNVSSAFLHLFRDDPSPTSSPNDVVGEVQFRGRDLAAANIVYGKIGVEIEDAIAATATGSFQWTLRDKGSNFDMMSLRDGVLGISRNSATLLPTQGAALVVNRFDASAGNGDEAGEISFNIDDGTERTYGEISVFWDNTSGGDRSSRMNFKLFSNDVLTPGLIIRGSAIANELVALEVSGESYIKAQSGGVIGFFVTDDPVITGSSIIGSVGTVQIPVINDGSPSASQLNAFFGSFRGAIGYDEDTAGTNQRIYIRNADGTWDFFDSAGSV